jgi:hypothetical protein
MTYSALVSSDLAASHRGAPSGSIGNRRSEGRSVRALGEPHLAICINARDAAPGPP